MFQYDTEKAREVAELTEYAVANMADASADNEEAMAFWRGVRDSLAEAIDYAEGDKPDDDAISEIADNAPDVYNYTRMQELVGTRTYMDECEMCDTHDDILTFAGHVLYQVAQRAVDAMIEQVFEI